MHCQFGFEYANCIPCRVVRHLLPPRTKKVLSMTLNCIWLWRSSSGTLWSVEYSFAITPRSTLTVPVGVPSMDEIDLFEMIYIRPCAKNENFLETATPKIWIWTRFLNLYTQNNSRRVDMLLEFLSLSSMSRKNSNLHVQSPSFFNACLPS